MSWRAATITISFKIYVIATLRNIFASIPKYRSLKLLVFYNKSAMALLLLLKKESSIGELTLT